MTQKIKDEINKWKGKMSETNLLEHINKTFHTDFTNSQIRYQVDLLFQMTLGHADIDAYFFVELAQKEVEEKGGFFEMAVNAENQLQKAIYLSATMLLYSDYFLDIVIVDATYKRNRFNLPLVNIIGKFFFFIFFIKSRNK